MQIPARQWEHIPKCLFAVALCVSVLVFGCRRDEISRSSERGETSRPSTGATPPEIPIELQIEQKLDPLTREDVELYLKVMRTAAERVKNLPASDHAALEDARKILANGATGRVPTSGDVKTLERANLVALYVDQIVAEEMKLDGRTYRGIVEAIESIVTNPALSAGPRDAAIPVPDRSSTALDARLMAVNAANHKFLTPYRDEIQNLIAIVRNPSNLPK